MNKDIDKVVHRIIDKIDCMWYKEIKNLDSIYICGGFAEYLAAGIREHYNNEDISITVLEDSIFSSAEGLYNVSKEKTIK
ncbi:MAG: hypothetical protein ACOCRK_09930 [bacterium]